MMDHAVEFLRGQTEPVPYGRVEDAIFGKRKYRRMAIGALLDDGTVTETPGPHGARLLTLTTSSPRSPHLAPTSPGELPDDLAPLAHPLQGGEQAGEVKTAETDDKKRGEVTTPKPSQHTDIDDAELERLATLTRQYATEAQQAPPGSLPGSPLFDPGSTKTTPRGDRS